MIFARQHVIIERNYTSDFIRLGLDANFKNKIRGKMPYQQSRIGGWDIIFTFSKAGKFTDLVTYLRYISAYRKDYKESNNFFKFFERCRYAFQIKNVIKNTIRSLQNFFDRMRQTNGRLPARTIDSTDTGCVNEKFRITTEFLPLHRLAPFQGTWLILILWIQTRPPAECRIFSASIPRTGVWFSFFTPTSFFSGRSNETDERCTLCLKS